MKTKDCISHFGGTKAKLAAALGIETPSVYTWGVYPPPLRQLQIERITGSKLKAEPDCFVPKSKKAVAAQAAE